MELMELARELGKAIQREPAYIALNLAAESNDADEKLQEQIQKFNLMRMQLNEAAKNEGEESDKVKEISADINKLYEEITKSEKMVAYNDARTELEGVIEKINQFLMAGANGEDMDSFQPHDHSSCGGSCSSCSGCH
ncbi:MAG: YlbF family regulator [Oscillospiraceae bacterium]|jgi:cell fate (sporulation/competence/biofilm development) regulator YlbF (YheA/YmcA/DUF963 family)|nr:YlbF family regulator [Oscillospiraceae bacterium]